jgi:hypothetical protein
MAESCKHRQFIDLGPSVLYDAGAQVPVDPMHAVLNLGCRVGVVRLIQRDAVYLIRN